jgi:hypothetical protein
MKTSANTDLFMRETIRSAMTWIGLEIMLATIRYAPYLSEPAKAKGLSYDYLTLDATLGIGGALCIGISGLFFRNIESQVTTGNFKEANSKKGIGAALWTLGLVGILVPLGRAVLTITNLN